jgi:hypothetical protein
VTRRANKAAKKARQRTTKYGPEKLLLAKTTPEVTLMKDPTDSMQLLTKSPPDGTQTMSSIVEASPQSSTAEAAIQSSAAETALKTSEEAALKSSRQEEASLKTSEEAALKISEETAPKTSEDEALKTSSR